jgi:uncharacterized protein
MLLEEKSSRHMMVNGCVLNQLNWRNKMLLQKIKADQLAARIKKDGIKTALLTTLIGDAEMIGKNDNRATTDAEVIAVIKKFLKNNLKFRKHLGGESGDVMLTTEQLILESYLPKQLTADELIKIITENFGDELKSKKGAIMKFLKENYVGLYDGATAAKVIG